MITSQSTPITYAGNGLATTFNYDFPATDASQVLVVLTDASGIAHTLTLGSDYSVAGVGNTDSSTWIVTYPALTSSDPVLPVGQSITVASNIPALQLTDFENQGGFYPQSYENAVDKLTLIAQQQQAQIDRAITVPLGSTSPTDPNDVLNTINAAAVTSTAAATSAAASAAAAAAYNPSTPVAAGTVLGNLTGGSAARTDNTLIALGNALTLARADIASAATTNIGGAASGYLRVTGTTTITAFDNVAAGIQRVLLFNGILTLTYNATSLILPGAANVKTAVGDVAVFVSEGSGNWRCVDYTTANGPAVGGGFSNLVVITSTGNWTVPAGVTRAKVTAVGGGGGGGGGAGYRLGGGRRWSGCCRNRANQSHSWRNYLCNHRGRGAPQVLPVRAVALLAAIPPSRRSPPTAARAVMRTPRQASPEARAAPRRAVP